MSVKGDKYVCLCMTEDVCVCLFVWGGGVMYILYCVMLWGVYIYYIVETQCNSKPIILILWGHCVF